MIIWSDGRLVSYISLLINLMKWSSFISGHMREMDISFVTRPPADREKGKHRLMITVLQKDIVTGLHKGVRTLQMNCLTSLINIFVSASKRKRKIIRCQSKHLRNSMICYTEISSSFLIWLQHRTDFAGAGKMVERNPFMQFMLTYHGSMNCPYHPYRQQDVDK